METLVVVVLQRTMGEVGVVTMVTTPEETTMVLEEALIDIMKVDTEEDTEGAIPTMVAEVEDLHHLHMVDGVAADVVVEQSEVEVVEGMILIINRENEVVKTSAADTSYHMCPSISYIQRIA